MKLKKTNELCYEIYSLAKKKAKLAKKEALNAYLELQKIKEQYNLELTDSEEESDNSDNFEESDEETEFSDEDINNERLSVASSNTDVSNISDLIDDDEISKTI
jgi:hypothetical protein